MLAALPVSLAFAQSAGEAHAALAPQPPKGKGNRCIADTDFMRRNHMSMLKHQRDETMHEGVRGKPSGLTTCVVCHAVKDEKGQFVTYASPKHFCRICHDYAAVSVDCFECHASRPEVKGSAALRTPGKTDFAMVERYLSAAHTEGRP